MTDPGDLMPESVEYERRQKLLQLFAWGATALPLLAFAFLTYQSVQLKAQSDRLKERVDREQSTLLGLEAEKRQLSVDIEELMRERDRLREDKVHYRSLAGVKVVFYRREDRELIETALRDLGLEIELREVRTLSRKADTLAYGPKVSSADCKAVAEALVTAGFPLRRIAPAEKVTEARLLQIYSSTRTPRDAPIFTPERIRNEGVCGEERR